MGNRLDLVATRREQGRRRLLRGYYDALRSFIGAVEVLVKAKLGKEWQMEVG